MPREQFQRELDALQDQVLLLGHRAGDQLQAAVVSLQEGDLDGAALLVRSDDAINSLHREIEAQVLELIATQQPVAGDMRLLAAVLEVATELERVGDYGKGIATITGRLGTARRLPRLVQIDQMAEIVAAMLDGALAAFVARDRVAASDVAARDDRVDALFEDVFEMMVRAGEADPALFEHANYMIWAAHNLERAADRTTNVCERVAYVATGAMRTNSR